MTKSVTKYTVVQHSAWAGKYDPQFRYAVEERGVSNKRDIARIEKAGGVLFDSYGEAADFAMDENYPPEVLGITPRVKGTFARETIEGAAIYVPQKKDA